MRSTVAETVSHFKECESSFQKTLPLFNLPNQSGTEVPRPLPISTPPPPPQPLYLSEAGPDAPLQALRLPCAPPPGPPPLVESWQRLPQSTGLSRRDGGLQDYRPSEEITVVKKCPQDAAEVLPRQHSCTPTRNGVRGGNERNRTHGASSKVGFLDSGNGTAPRC
ncbi:hypothetical protein NQZ68_013912 [Dissostichus eleginoides]|nr:hypothetical protein NQZ68_013912 [Dissostichus eleginoides]